MSLKKPNRKKLESTGSRVPGRHFFLKAAVLVSVLKVAILASVTLSQCDPDSQGDSHTDRTVRELGACQGQLKTGKMDAEGDT